ncbi:MAG: hypothetical protein F9K36_14160, partial [Burkholderiaceae bacterium]
WWPPRSQRHARMTEPFSTDVIIIPAHNRCAITLDALRALAAELPLSAVVLETDAPDIPPQWLYRNAEQRARGEVARNEPAELPRIAQMLASLRGWSLEQTAAMTTANAHAALPRLRTLPEAA